MLATLKELNHCPDKSCDEENPDKSTKTSSGSEQAKTRLEEDDVTLKDCARLAVDKTTIIKAIADVDVVNK